MYLNNVFHTLHTSHYLNILRDYTQLLNTFGRNINTINCININNHKKKRQPKRNNDLTTAKFQINFCRINLIL